MAAVEDETGLQCVEAIARGGAGARDGAAVAHKELVNGRKFKIENNDSRNYANERIDDGRKQSQLGTELDGSGGW
jgi:hypothetical protein